MKKTIRLVAILFCFIFVFACKGKQIGGAVPPPGDGDLGPGTDLTDYVYPCEPGLDEGCDEAEKCTGEDCEEEDTTPITTLSSSFGSDRGITAETIVDFPDPLLATKVREALELEEDEAITHGQLQRLTVLSAASSPHAGDPSIITDLTGIEHCHELTELNLTNSQVENIAFLFKLTKLKKLNLAYTPLTDFSFLSRLQNLEELNLQRTNIKNLNYLRSLYRKLKILDLSFNHELESFSSLMVLTNLQELHLSNTNITDADLAFLVFTTQLVELDLSYTEIRDLSPVRVSYDLGSFRNEDSEINLRGTNVLNDWIDGVENEFALQNNNIISFLRARDPSIEVITD